LMPPRNRTGSKIRTTFWRGSSRVRPGMAR